LNILTAQVSAALRNLKTTVYRKLICQLILEGMENAEQDS
jgi:hypothetical protein